MREPVTSFVSSEDSVEVAIHDYGGQGHPTIFVHGTGLASRMWEPIIERLGANFRAICVDLRAHGATTNPLDINFFDHRMVADLSAAADALALKDAWVVGRRAFWQAWRVPRPSVGLGSMNQSFLSEPKSDLSELSILLR